MIAVSGVLRFRAEDVAFVRDEVTRIMVDSRQDVGCIEYWWAEDLEEPGAFRFFECWDSPASFHAHRAQPFEGEFAERVLPRLVGVEAHEYEVSDRRLATG